MWDIDNMACRCAMWGANKDKWDVGFGMWDVAVMVCRCPMWDGNIWEVWDVGYRRWDVECGM